MSCTSQWAAVGLVAMSRCMVLLLQSAAVLAPNFRMMYRHRRGVKCVNKGARYSPAVLSDKGIVGEWMMGAVKTRRGEGSRHAKIFSFSSRSNTFGP